MLQRKTSESIDLQYVHLLFPVPGTCGDPFSRGAARAAFLDYCFLWRHVLSLLCLRHGGLLGRMLPSDLPLGGDRQQAVLSRFTLVCGGSDSECGAAGHLQVLELLYRPDLFPCRESGAVGAAVSSAGHLVFYV